MVSVVQLRPQNTAAALEPIAAGLRGEERALLARALEFAQPLYAGQTLSTGEPVWSHALGLATNLAAIGLDPAGRAAGVLFAAPKFAAAADVLHEKFGDDVAALAAGVEKLYQLRVLTRGTAQQQIEILRQMVLGMVEDIRIVLIRLASRTQTLRWYAKNPSADRAGYARETLDIYAPLANRLGVWQLKWELEDLSFRFLEPETYKKIAQMLDEKRAEREQYIQDAMALLARELGGAGVEAEIAGRPKHIYSIWNKMRSKALDFSELYDVRALRVIVGSAKECYAALGVVHDLWQPIPKEFDDYISRPKGNDYQSLHTAVIGPGRQDARGADPHRRDAPSRRVRRRGALALQGARRAHARAGQVRGQDRLAAPAAGVARRGDRRLEVGRKDAPGGARRHGLRRHAAGQGGRPAGGLDAGGFRLRAAHRPRAPLPRRQGRRAHRPARDPAQERAAGRDHGRQERRAVARLAQPGARLRQEPARAAEDQAVVQQPGAVRDRRQRPRGGGKGAQARGREPGQARDARRAARLFAPGRSFRRGRARRSEPAPAAGGAARHGRRGARRRRPHRRRRRRAARARPRAKAACWWSASTGC